MNKPRNERDWYLLTASRLLANPEYEPDYKVWESLKDKLIWKDGKPLNTLAAASGYDKKTAEIMRKYDIAKPYDPEFLRQVVKGQKGLVAEMSRIVDIIETDKQGQTFLTKEPGYLYLKIKYDESSDLILSAVSIILKHIKKYGRQGKQKRFRKEQVQAIRVWEERRLRKPFWQIAQEMNIREPAAKKQFYKAYELIYGRKYNPADYEKPQIKKEYLKKTCNTCKERQTCKNLCPDVIILVEQDGGDYLREKNLAKNDNFFRGVWDDTRQDIPRRQNDGRWRQG